MFYGQSLFNHDVSNFDFSSAKGFSGVRYNVFTNCTNFNNGQAPGESTAPLTIDCGTGESLAGLFQRLLVVSINRVTLKNTSTVTSMGSMFYGATPVLSTNL